MAITSKKQRITIFADTAPTVNDDNLHFVGQHWVDTETGLEYICKDNTEGSAVWAEIGGGGSGESIVEIIYSELETLVSNEELTVGQKYLITDHQRRYLDFLGSEKFGIVEPIIVSAVTTSAFNCVAQSKTFPNHIIYYNFSNNDSLGVGRGSDKGYIYRRIDTKQNNDIGYDFINIKSLGLDRLTEYPLTNNYTNFNNVTINVKKPELITVPVFPNLIFVGCVVDNLIIENCNSVDAQFQNTTIINSKIEGNLQIGEVAQLTEIKNCFFRDIYWFDGINSFLQYLINVDFYGGQLGYIDYEMNQEVLDVFNENNGNPQIKKEISTTSPIGNSSAEADYIRYINEYGDTVTMNLFNLE